MWINNKLIELNKLKFFLHHRDLKSGTLEPKAIVLPMSYTDPIYLLFIPQVLYYKNLKSAAKYT